MRVKQMILIMKALKLTLELDSRQKIIIIFCQDKIEILNKSIDHGRITLEKWL